jgi:hypothetical protein
MKHFALGFVTALLLILIVIPQYSDYRHVAETQRWVGEIRPVMERIEKNILKNASLVDANIGVDKMLLSGGEAKQPDVFEITRLGEIILRGGSHGQLLILIPAFEEGKVRWRCIGGPERIVPKTCRKEAS